MNSVWLAFPLFIVGSYSTAETLTFAVDENVMIVRSYDQYDEAVVEFIGEAGAFYQCIVLGPDENPIATTNAIADTGRMSITGITAAEVADVKCRRTR